MSEKLDDFRRQIDKIDRQMVELLHKRARIAGEVGKIKKKRDLRLYVPEREKEVVERVLELNRGRFPEASMRRIYNEITSACLNLEKPLQVAYLGPEATFTHSAAMERFGAASSYKSRESVDEVFDVVSRGEVDFGVVPIENSQEGAVRHTLDRFLESNLYICSESYLAIDLCLLGQMENLKEVELLCSHRQAFAQSRQWIEKNLSHVEIREVNSTARAAEMASQEPGTAAVASPVAAEIYNLGILAQKIEDSLDNYTRFLVLGREIPSPTEDDKTTIAFSVKDRVGALYDTLEPFGKMDVNMTKIESRPAKSKTWDYIFFVDFLGHQEEDKIKQLLGELKSQTPFFKILGSYPREEPFDDR